MISSLVALVCCQFHSEGCGRDVGDSGQLHLVHVRRPGRRRVPAAAAGDPRRAAAGRGRRAAPATLQKVALPCVRLVCHESVARVGDASALLSGVLGTFFAVDMWCRHVNSCHTLCSCASKKVRMHSDAHHLVECGKH